MEKTELEALDKAIGLLSGVTAMAKVVPGVKNYQTIQQWRISGVPAEYCPVIERATNGAVTCEELRADLSEQWAYLRGTTPTPEKVAA